MRLQICFLLFTLIAGIFPQSCRYVKNIPVKYRRFSRAYEGKVFLSECINDQSIRVWGTRFILIECEATKLPELEPNFVSNMSSLETITIRGCNTSTVHARAFSNLPSLRSIIIENNNISHISRGVFEDLPKLNSIYLHSNNITTIAEEAFAKLPTLRHISLKNNSIKRMLRNWFTNLTNIQDFSITNNQIEEVPPMMFKGWCKGVLFDLSQNFISVIHREAFANISNTVIVINLGRNYLKEVDADSFSIESVILEFRLDFNLFNYIPEDFLRSIRVRNIALIGNPFKCSCLIRTYETLTQRRIWESCSEFCSPTCNMAAVPVCASSSTASEYCIETVDNEVTDKITSYMDKLGYSSLHDWANHCKSPRP